MVATLNRKIRARFFGLYYSEIPICIVLAALLGSVASHSAIAQSEIFIDRQQSTDLRVVSYNVFKDTIFPDINLAQSEKFVRVVSALDPDILNLQEINVSSVEDVVRLMDNIAPLATGSWYAHKGGDNVIVSKYPLSMTQTIVFPPGSQVQAIALVDLPDEQFGSDFYLLNNHFPCCGSVGSPQDIQRQKQSDAIVSWIRDARTTGGLVNLPPRTPIAIVGDLNIDLNVVGSLQAVETLIEGDILDESTYGSDSPPDWDDSSLLDAHPLHNGSGPEDYTWRNNNSQFVSGRIDYIIYSDSVLDVANQFVLNTISMSALDLEASGLQKYDISLDLTGTQPDHLPVVVDFRLSDFSDSDFNLNRAVDHQDLAIFLAGYGITSDAGRMDGDANGDGIVDGHDFLRWQREYMETGSVSLSIPEPSSLTLLLVSLLLFIHPFC